MNAEMKKYILEDLENFEVDENGYKICPSGDYTKIMEFPSRCIFGEQSIFGRLCNFGEQCRFGERCRFGGWSSFGRLCSFDEQCSFGSWCSFGERCRFGGQCKVENNKEIKEMIKFEGFGSIHRCTYFFKLTDEQIYVRCGCFAGYINEFREQVKETHGDNKFAKEYEAVADLAEMHFGD